MPGAFLYDNVVQGATLASAEASVATLPLSNLQDAQPRRRTRLMGSAATVTADLGSNKSIDCAALISTTLGAGATVRARIGTEAALVEAVPIVDFDFMTGVLDPRLTVSRSSAAWNFNSSGNLVQAANNTARFDHDPVTLEPRGYLLEPTRINAALYSRDFTNAAWVKTNITAALDVVGLDGAANTASSLTATAANATVLQTITAASAARVTSFYVRRITGTGTVEITQDNGATWTAISITGTWQRFATAVATITNPVIGLRLGTDGDVVAVDVAQCEIGSFATSPILTTATAVTRAFETFSMPYAVPSNFSMYYESQHMAAALTGTLSRIGVDSGSTANYFYSRVAGVTTSNIIDILAASNSVVIADLSNQQLVLSSIVRQAAAYAPNDLTNTVNGSAISVDTSGVLPALTRISMIGQGEAITYMRRFKLYDSRLSNAQLVALSGTGSSLVAAEVTGDTGTIAAEAEDANQGNVILTLPAPALGRFLRIDIDNPAAAYTDVGVLAAGALWRTIRSIAYGIEEGRLMLDRRDRNPFTGAEFPVPAIANPRYARFTLPVLSDAEVKASHRELVRLLGAAGDGLVIPDIADGLAERNRRALWGALNEPGGNSGTVMVAYNINERSFLVTERI
jgi:hypothetical protein